MTRTDYIILAALLRVHVRPRVTMAAYEVIVDGFTKRLGELNPRFDKLRFDDAAYPPEDER